MSAPTLNAGGVTFLGCPMSIQAYTRGSLSKHARNLWTQYFMKHLEEFHKNHILVHLKTNMNWVDIAVKRSKVKIMPCLILSKKWGHMHRWLPIMFCLVNIEVVVSCLIWLLRLELHSRPWGDFLTNLAVSCRYFPPGLQLAFQPCNIGVVWPVPNCTRWWQTAVWTTYLRIVPWLWSAPK